MKSYSTTFNIYLLKEFKNANYTQEILLSENNDLRNKY